jgi:4-carboxymuconolactone decarboxylase
MGQGRVGVVPDDQLTDAQKKVLEDVKVGPLGKMFDPLLPMLRNPGMAYTAQRFGEAVYFNSGLDKRIYELTVCLLGRAMTQQFEWRVHYPLAIKAGIKQENVDAIAAGRKPPSLAEDEQVTYDFVVELFTKNDVSDATYKRFVDKLGVKAVADVVGVLGYYGTIAYMLNVDRTPIRGDNSLPLLKPLEKPLP